MTTAIWPPCGVISLLTYNKRILSLHTSCCVKAPPVCCIITVSVDLFARQGSFFMYSVSDEPRIHAGRLDINCVFVLNLKKTFIFITNVRADGVFLEVDPSVRHNAEPWTHLSDVYCDSLISLLRGCHVHLEPAPRKVKHWHAGMSSDFCDLLFSFNLQLKKLGNS